MKIDKMKSKRPKSEGGNLVPITSSEMAREYQRRGVETRRARAKELEEFKVLSKEMKEFSAVDIMRAQLGRAIEKGDEEAIFKYTKELAPYESPKLASQQVDLTTRALSELSDEEFAAELAKLEDGEKNEKDCDCDEPSTCPKCV